MKRGIQIVVDDIKVKGYVTFINPEAVMVKIREPELYACEAICHCDAEAEHSENLLTALYRIVNCINDILRNDTKQLAHLEVKLHHAKSRTKLLANCMEIAERLFSSNAIPSKDVKLLYSVIQGEYIYWQSQKVRIFNVYFKEYIGRWEFRTFPMCVIQQLGDTHNK